MRAVTKPRVGCFDRLPLARGNRTALRIRTDRFGIPYGGLDTMRALDIRESRTLRQLQNVETGESTFNVR